MNQRQIDLTREDILQGLDRINELAKQSGIIVDMAIYGGAALSIAFDITRITRDVDVVVKGDTKFLRWAVTEVAKEMSWEEDWLNDAVKGFTSGSEELVPVEQYREATGGGLRVFVPTPEYIFAMKCMSMRTDIRESSDVNDIRYLATQIPIESVDQALGIVEQFYPKNLIQAKVQMGIEEIIGDFLDENKASFRFKKTPSPELEAEPPKAKKKPWFKMW